MFKTVTTLVFYSALILITLYVLQILFLNVYYEKYKINEVKDISKEIEKNKDNLYTFLENKSIEKDICIEYITKDGSFIYNQNSKGCLFLNPNNQIIYTMNDMMNSKKEITFYQIENPKYKTKSLLYGKRINNYSYVFINSQLENLDSAHSVINSQLIYLLGVIIILSIIISIIISDYITKPILEITQKAKRMGKESSKIEFHSSNISEIKELAETLNFANEEIHKMDTYRRDLMANVSHDLKTPLTLIKSYAEMVRDISYKDEEKRKEHLDVIIEETERLNILVEDILTLSKIETKESELKLEEYDIVEQIKNIISKFKILETTESYKFILKAPEQAFIKADKIKMEQVIYNLLTNAINYTGDDMTIKINVIETKMTYKIEIIDTGKGIDKNIIDKIWERYYKTDKKHKRNKLGTGLGLSIVKNILEKHNFKYGVKSLIGKGSTFYFVIEKHR